MKTVTDILGNFKEGMSYLCWVAENQKQYTIKQELLSDTFKEQLITSDNNTSN
jgi:hypothetical protein